MNNILKKGLLAIAVFPLITSCSDQFLQDKEDYNGFNEEIYDNLETATAKVDYMYYLLLPSGTTGGSNESEELAGLSDVTNPTKVMSTANVADKFWVKKDGPWAYIRECNLFLEMIDKGSLSKDDTKYLKGQIYFWRAWAYWSLVKIYGGVPIVLEAQNAIIGDGDVTQSSLAVQRSSTAASIKQICEDLELAANNLPGRWGDSDWGRITSGAAKALKGRILLTYASPLFNRDGDVQRWSDAYEACAAAKKDLEDNGFGLADGKGNRAKNWEKMFLDIDTKEAVMTVLFNNRTDEYARNNGWENNLRPKDLQGGGGVAATAEMVDLFPMADGKKPEESSYQYDKLKFYKNRDPRFYRTFAFNGMRWPYKQAPEYTVWNYQWYENEDKMNNTPQNPAGYAEYSGRVSSNIYVRKRSNPEAEFNETKKFALVPTPYMEIRFAEVVLNLAEAAAMSNHLPEAYTLLKSIRERVGYTGDCGLNSAIQSDANKMVEAILYERLIEFAYEGKRADDLRRWMLYNNDFGTCGQIGYTPLQGQRRHGIYLAIKPEVYTAQKSGEDFDVFNPDSKNFDPKRVTRAGISLDPSADDAEFNAQIAKLDNFYDTNLVRIENNEIDTKDKNTYLTFTYKNSYYFMGIAKKVLQQSPYLLQNKGWEDHLGAEGTFDPLK